MAITAEKLPIKTFARHNPKVAEAKEKEGKEGKTSQILEKIMIIKKNIYIQDLPTTSWDLI